MIKARAIFENMDYRFGVNALSHCVTLLGNNIGKENIYKFIRLILLFNSKARYNMEMSHTTYTSA